MSTMESDFGEYITKQYGLLKQILSCLNVPRDLGNARLVCREWRSVIDSVVDKNPTALRICCGTPSLTKPVIPALVMYQSSNQDTLKKCSKCKKTIRLCPCQVSGPDTIFISIPSDCGHHDPETHTWSTFMDCSYALVLPSSPHIQVSTFYANLDSPIFKQPITDEVVNLCLGGEERIKCLLIIASPRRYAKIKWIDDLLRHIIQRQGLTFAVGGGNVPEMTCKKGYKFSKGNNWETPEIVLIALRGESMSAYSNVLRDFKPHKIKNFMEEMAGAVGPVPDGGSRIAFIARCVDRLGWEEYLESIEFQSAFPSVLEYGFPAVGEYGVKSFSSGIVDQEGSQNKRQKRSFDQIRTTSFVILTFNKV